ncbi:DUF427 domain-containing protein [Microbacterium gilvum]|uniref:DUF427 domain-containing protein n=1 Tax=Microbacterium gilvum TaxID=1336204 RepID=UPI0031EDE1C7
MRAIWHGEIVAEAAREELVRIEGNWYFPPSSVRDGALAESATPYTCPWKGVAQYWDIRSGAGLPDGAWSYPHPFDGAADRVGREFAGYVAFDPRVTIEE